MIKVDDLITSILRRVGAPFKYREAVTSSYFTKEELHVILSYIIKQDDVIHELQKEMQHDEALIAKTIEILGKNRVD